MLKNIFSLAAVTALAATFAVSAVDATETTTKETTVKEVVTNGEHAALVRFAAELKAAGYTDAQIVDTVVNSVVAHNGVTGFSAKDNEKLVAFVAGVLTVFAVYGAVRGAQWLLKKDDVAAAGAAVPPAAAGNAGDAAVPPASDVAAAVGTGVPTELRTIRGGGVPPAPRARRGASPAPTATAAH